MMIFAVAEEGRKGKPMKQIDADALINEIKKDTEKAIEQDDKVGSFWLGYIAGLVIKQPTIQPEERTDKRTETHACDCISRKTSEPTLEQVELYCKRRCLTVISDEMLAKLIEERDSILAGAIPVSWIEAKIERFKAEDNAFCGLTANIMFVMLNEWKREQEGETE